MGIAKKSFFPHKILLYDEKLINICENVGFVLFGERISESDHKHYLQYLNFI